ncbi:MAG: SDR family oxidoreductase [Methylobacterium sp.]|nr:SDR family oxidoreductase [Methylobacterium sp.]MCA3607065.1 SDR family oxidoreductase [Methylobacterium sp.]MCA3609346.1 SDR family oxidoreductase [Methylobacterium sp.]MCA3619073.1 SDR family oxidoreductase [Methylobacterium sp.]MCA3621827.1 SDR family oxidoreductase [Methylobacterium sp.]
MRLQGKTALITGAGSGFGEGIAKTFAREGARVGVVDINLEGARRVASEIGTSAIAVKADMTSMAETGLAVQATVEFGGGRIDIVVNNAGWSHRNKPMLEVTEEEFDRVYAINVKAIFHMSRAIIPHFRAKGGGVILNIGSTAGIRPRPGLTWYNSTKGAVNLLSRSMAVELAPDRIRVNCVAPVIGATGLLEQFMGMPDTLENRAKFLGTIPLGRFSTPADIANACLFLASDEAEFVTGVVLEVDGGRTI